MRLLGGGPEAGDAEAVIEIRAEVIHPSDGEDDVHAELDGIRLCCSSTGHGMSEKLVLCIP